jgi:hypothetical protein
MKSGKREIEVSTSMELEGEVTYSEGWRLKITVGKAPKPEANLYVDGNPLHLVTGDRVRLKVEKL